MEKMKLVAKTFYGLENVLAEELRSLGASDIDILNRAVSFIAEKELLYKSNLWLRTALRILKPIHVFNAVNENELYEGIMNIDWQEYLSPGKTFAIDSVVSSEYFKHSKYTALKSKDAIVDQIRKKTGIRPNVDVVNPSIRINLHIAGKKCTVSLDSSGEPLFKRGYRTDTLAAPLNEVLSAGLVMISGWDGTGNFIDPMCGSGTILIEAALIALNIPPGTFRKNFGFQNWRDFDRKLWYKIKKEAKSKKNETGNLNILGYDISNLAINATRTNISNAGLEDCICIDTKAFEEMEPPSGEGILISNPPYDERLKDKYINESYSKIGSRLKHTYQGYDAWLICGNKEALKHVGLHPSEKHTLYNGAIECQYRKYSLYEGSKKG